MSQWTSNREGMGTIRIDRRGVGLNYWLGKYDEKEQGIYDKRVWLEKGKGFF